MRFHIIAAVLVVFAGFVFKVNSFEWLALIIAIALVIIAELFNTAIEAVVDLYTKEYSELAKTAKDVAAGAVLIAAIISVVIGLIVFAPHFVELFS